MVDQNELFQTKTNELLKIEAQIQVAKKNIKKLFAQYSILQKELERCQKVRDTYKEQLLFETSVGFGLELLLELFVWPYATWNKKSILYSYVNKLFPVSSSGRFILTIATAYLWLQVISGISAVLKSLWQSTETRERSAKSLENDLKDDNRPIESIMKTPRGGFQTLIDAVDPAFLEIKAIKIKREFDSLSFQSRAKSKWKNISQKLKDKRVLIQVIVAVIIYIQILSSGPKRKIPTFEAPHNFSSPSVVNPIVSGPPANQGRKILLKGSNLILAEKPIPVSSTEPFNPIYEKSREEFFEKTSKSKNTKSVERRFKNYKPKKRKQVGRLSDFTREEFIDDSVILDKVHELQELLEKEK